MVLPLVTMGIIIKKRIYGIVQIQFVFLGAVGVSELNKVQGEYNKTAQVS